MFILQCIVVFGLVGALSSASANEQAYGYCADHTASS